MREKSRVTPETLLPYRRRRAALGKNVTGRPSACPGRHVPVPGPVAGHAQGWRAGMNATSRTWLPSDGSTRLSWHSQSEQTGMSTAPAVSRDRLLASHSPGPGHLAVLARPGVVGAAPTFPSVSSVRLPPASAACCDRPQVGPCSPPGQMAPRGAHTRRWLPGPLLGRRRASPWPGRTRPGRSGRACVPSTLPVVVYAHDHRAPAVQVDPDVLLARYLVLHMGVSSSVVRVLVWSPTSVPTLVPSRQSEVPLRSFFPVATGPCLLVRRRPERARHAGAAKRSFMTSFLKERNRTGTAAPWARRSPRQRVGN